MSAVGKEMEPALSKINQDYWNAKLTLPGQNAAARYNLASTQGTANAEALRKKLQTMYGPLSSTWGTTLTGANVQTQPTNPNQGAENLFKLASTVVPFFA